MKTMMIRYFFETHEEDCYACIAQWNDNDSRMIFLGIGLPEERQLSALIQDIRNNPHKDILAIRFPDKQLVTNNEIVKSLQNGEGITIINKDKDDIWYPNEIWIYIPI
jgi:hypothetical protein